MATGHKTGISADLKVISFSRSNEQFLLTHDFSGNNNKACLYSEIGAMQLFGRRRRRLVSAQFSNLYMVLHELCIV